MAVESSTVVDPAVGVFFDPAAGLDLEPVGGLGPGYDLDADPGLCCGLCDGRAGVALVQPEVSDGGCDRLALGSSAEKAARSWTSAGVRVAATRMPAVSRRMWRLIASTFLASSKPRGPVTGDAFTDEESTTAAEGRLRRHARARTSSRTAASALPQIPARHQRRKCGPPAPMRCRTGRKRSAVGGARGHMTADPHGEV